LFDDILTAQDKSADKIFENHMKYFVTGLFIGLMVGLVITTSGPDSNVKQTDILQPRIKKINTPLNKSQWRIASLSPGSAFPSGRSVKKLVKNINFLTGTTLELKLFEPGTLVPVFSSFDAVSSGRIEAAVSSPSFWGGEIAQLSTARRISIWPWG
jgi:TRAP-type mannitol/chloroaromatic compound transport system substrate-binding protein